MKLSYDEWWLLGLLTLAGACSDSRSSDTSGVKGEAHAGGHSSTSGDGHKPGNGGHLHEHAQPADSALLWVAAAANKVVISDQVSLPVRLTDTTVTVKGYGRVEWDQRRHREVSTRTGGRVERLFVRYQNQYVHKGQKILELYTPEVATYAAEYLHHLQTPGDEELLALSRKKLTLLGITSGQLKELERTGHIPSRFAVYSPYSGYAQVESSADKMNVSMPDASLPTSGGMGGSMEGGSSPSEVAFEGAAGGQALREGVYVNRGQTLFYLNDFAVAWGVLSFDGDAQAFLRPGMDVLVKSELLPLPIRATIAFIEPAFDEGGQRFAQVRVYLSNGSRRFKVHSLIEGTVDIPLAQKLIIPAASVLSLGQRKVVWVKIGATPGGRNIFTVRDVQVSMMSNKIAVIRGGLSPGEEVAADAGYLLDNQSLVEP